MSEKCHERTSVRASQPSKNERRWLPLKFKWGLNDYGSCASVNAFRGGIHGGPPQTHSHKQPLFVSNQNERRKTTVKYDSPEQIFMWRRLNGTSWTPENLVESATSPQEAERLLRRGTRTTPNLKAGQYVEYGLLAEQSLDPNAVGSIGFWPIP